jgi:altronate dehydratase
VSSAARHARAVLVLDAADNVAVALENLDAGAETGVEAPGGEMIRAREAIRAAHKVAIRSIAAGQPVIKYGEVIGVASAAIAPGAHVHVHNVASGRLPGPERDD